MNQTKPDDCDCEVCRMFPSSPATKPMHVDFPPGGIARCACEECAAPAPEAKPTRVEVGQRWSWHPGRPSFVVDRPDSENDYVWVIRDPDGSEDGMTEAGVLSCTFLGYAKPAVTSCAHCDDDDVAACTCAKTAAPAFTGPALAPALKHIQDAPSAPPRPIRREVSCDGRNWVDYARLADGDAFEAYSWRRRSTPGGRCVEVDGPAPKPDLGRAETAGDQAGMAAAALVTWP